MEKMKRLTILFALFACLSSLKAQETTYYLPSTTITVAVEAEQECFFAGPYAAYAQNLLNLDVRRQDKVTTHVRSVELIPRVEADTRSHYTLDAEVPELLSLSAQGLVSLGDRNTAAQTTWRFLPGLSADFTDKGVTGSVKEVKRIVYKTVPTDTAFVRVPVEQLFTEDKTLEDRAREAADIILSARKDRMDIASGNTDASFSGAAMADALNELRRIEEEYLALFRGYSVVRPLSASFDVIPSAASKSQRYLVFRTDPELGLVSNGRGTPYYLELEPEKLSAPDLPDKKKGKGLQVHYRIPMVCKIRLTRDGSPMLETRIPLYQMGKEVTYPVKNN